MDKVSDKNSAKAEDEIEEKELSEMDVKKIMIFRQIGAKIAYYRTLRQMTLKLNLLNALTSVKVALVA